MPEASPSGAHLPIISNEHLEDRVIIEETARQVVKDFKIYDCEISFDVIPDGHTPYQVLFEQIEPYIERMLREDATILFSLLYTIDIPDHWWSHLRHESDHVSLASTLTDLILRRELLKVLTRMKFRQGRIDHYD